MSDSAIHHTPGTEAPHSHDAQANERLRLALIERINVGDLAAADHYLNFPIGPEINHLKLSQIEIWKYSREHIGGRYAPQIFAILETEWAQRATCLDHTAALQHLEQAQRLIFSAPLIDAVVTETAAWLHKWLCPDDSETLGVLHDALLQQLNSAYSVYWATDGTNEAEVADFADGLPESQEVKSIQQIANEMLVFVRMCRGPHKARWFSSYDPDAPAADAKPLTASQEEPFVEHLTRAEQYFRRMHDPVGIAMAVHQRALLRGPGVTEQSSPDLFVPSMCEAAELYGDAKDSLREMLCWQRAALAASPGGLRRPLPEPMKYVIARVAEAARAAGLEGEARATDKYFFERPANSRASVAIALAVLVLLAAALFKGDDTLIGLMLFGFVLLVHEAGHWIAAQCAGIRIETFRVGVGPRLFTTKVAGTDFEVHAFPVLGYVSPVQTTGAWEKHLLSRSANSESESTEKNVPPAVFSETPIAHSDLVSRPRRILFSVGGVAANFLVATLSLWLLGIVDTQSRTHTAPVIGYVWAGSKASAAGVQVGDRIAAVQGKPCLYFGDESSKPLLKDRTQGDPASVPVTLLRGTDSVTVDWPLIAKDEWGWFGNGVATPHSWTISEVHATCTDSLRPGDVIEQVSWAGHVVRREETASPQIIDWVFQQAGQEPVLLKVRRGKVFCDVQVRGIGGHVFDPEQILDVEPRLVDVVRGSVAWQAGFRPGDLVRAINGMEIKTHRQLRDELQGSLKRSVPVVIEREKNTITFTMPSDAAFRDYANWGLSFSDWFPSLRGLEVTSVRPEWASLVPNLTEGARLEDIYPLEPFVIRWCDKDGKQCSEDLTTPAEKHSFFRPVGLPPFRLESASITLPPDGPLAIAAKLAGQATEFFWSLPKIMASSATEVPSSSERQWIRNAASRGYIHLLGVWAYMNLAVAVFNLLPIPPLDGFRCVQHFAGGLTRRKLPQSFQIAVNIAGWLTLLGLTALFFFQIVRDAVTALFM